MLPLSSQRREERRGAHVNGHMRLRNALAFVVLATAGVLACSGGADGGTIAGITPTEGTSPPDDASSGGPGARTDGGGPGTPGPAKCEGGCGDGQVCSEGKCVDLPSTCPCPVESYCDLATNTCKAGCTSHDQCSKGRFCDTAKRTCKDGCRTAIDCAEPANGSVTCNAGTCVTSCDTKFHACGAACKSDTDPTACGAA